MDIGPILPEVVLDLDRQSIDGVTKRLWPRRKDPLGVIVHALRTFRKGDRPPAADQPGYEEMVGVLVDNRTNQLWYDGRLSVIETRYGLRFVPHNARGLRQTEAQPHVDQCLAILGELGYTLDDPIETPFGRRPVRALLTDSIANFDISQEIEWTAMALTLYLPPRRSWRNRHGTEFHFDQLARELMSRPFERSSCGGTHLLFASAALLRADRESPVLTSTTRADLEFFLRKVVEAVVRAQTPDGVIDPYWYRPLVKEPWYQRYARMGSFPPEVSNLRSWYEGDEERPKFGADRLVQATGHHVEWMLLLPREMQPDPGSYRRAANYLAGALREASDEELKKDFCPYSHAARLIRQFAKLPDEFRGRVSSPSG